MHDCGTDDWSYPISKGLFVVDVNPVRGGPEVLVQKIPVDLSGAQGMIDTDDGLYVNLHNRGMFLVADSDGDGMFDKTETPTPMRGGGEHGDLFTFDADMEWDMGMPWYRPTLWSVLTVLSILHPAGVESNRNRSISGRTECLGKPIRRR